MAHVHVDPGHWYKATTNGQIYDPGAVGRDSGLREAEVNLDVAKRAAHLLREVGCQTNLPKPDTNQQGVAEANAVPADAFVSIHSNSAADRRAHGVEVLYFSEQGKQLASAILNAISAEVIQGQGKWLTQPVNLAVRGVKKRTDLYVLKAAHMPACLVEVAFISNAAEEKLLANALFKQAVAQAIADGTVAYLTAKGVI